jgi:hypothetical protein
LKASCPSICLPLLSLTIVLQEQNCTVEKVLKDGGVAACMHFVLLFFAGARFAFEISVMTLCVLVMTIHCDIDQWMLFLRLSNGTHTLSDISFVSEGEALETIAIWGCRSDVTATSPVRPIIKRSPKPWNPFHKFIRYILLYYLHTNDQHFIYYHRYHHHVFTPSPYAFTQNVPL